MSILRNRNVFVWYLLLLGTFNNALLPLWMFKTFCLLRAASSTGGKSIWPMTSPRYHTPKSIIIYDISRMPYCWKGLTLKEPGGAESAPLRHFLLYLCRLLFFRAETSSLFSFKPCARFKTIFIKIGPRVMTRRCVIARWVQRKTDFPLKLHTNRVFCLFCLSGYTSTMFYLIYLVYLE